MFLCISNTYIHDIHTYSCIYVYTHFMNGMYIYIYVQYMVIQCTLIWLMCMSLCIICIYRYPIVKPPPLFMLAWSCLLSIIWNQRLTWCWRPILLNSDRSCICLPLASGRSSWMSLSSWQALLAQVFSPQLCVGFLFLILYPGLLLLLPPPPSHTQT